MQVYNYYTLSNARPRATINTVLGIRQAVGQLKTDLVNAATRQGRGPQSFAYGSHLKIVINATNTPGFEEGLRRGNITFFLDVNRNYFQLAVRILAASKKPLQAFCFADVDTGSPLCDLPSNLCHATL